MSFLGAIETATSLINFATAISDAARGNRDERRRYHEIVRVLRSIYFTPRGTIRILQTLADGERPTPEAVLEIVPDFNDAEWRVGRIIEILDFDHLERFSDISLRQRRMLNEIAAIVYLS